MHTTYYVIHAKTGLPKDTLDISRVVRQVYYNPESFESEVEKHDLEKVESKEIFQARHEERQVVLFKSPEAPISGTNTELSSQTKV